MDIRLTNAQRLQYIKTMISIALIVIFFISRKLWLNERNYPLAPVFDLPMMPAPYDWIQFAVPVLLLAMVLFFRNASVFIFAFFILFWVLVLGDQNRLQPYCFMFAFMLLPLAGKHGAAEEENRSLNTLRLIVIGTYIWSGIHKVNVHFIDRFYPFITGHWEVADGFFKRELMLVVPLTEFLIGMGLMLKRTRRLSLYLAVFMHFCIIVFLSPLGLGWNYVVVPWNAALIAVNIFLFREVHDLELRTLWSWERSPMKMLVVFIFFILPFFNFFGFWDHYLSSSLYSFKAPYGNIYVDEALRNKLPAYLDAYYRTDDNKDTYISTTYWMIGEINAAPYPEERVYNTVKDFICTFDTRDSCHARLQLNY